ncbi:MAG TPA: Crp/Fnr family transcriptional regulator [Pyrinomonadaceae bacterium]|nr:Crp/Fnr family transcriptional regulator [Pyrinomonadaceae bacterium]
MNVAIGAVAATVPGDRQALRVLPFNSPWRSIPGIDRVSRSRIYAKGAVVFHEGHAARGIYILSSGRAKVSIASADGKKLIIRIARGGEVLGLYAGLTGRPFEATAEMVEGGRVDFISRPDLLDLLAHQQAFSMNLVEMFSRQFSDLVDHTRMLLLSESALEKLARLILRWDREFGERTSEGIRVRMVLTQEEIAQIIGASRETVTRLLSALKRDQLIRVKRDSLWIRDYDALAALAQTPETFRRS